MTTQITTINQEIKIDELKYEKYWKVDGEKELGLILKSKAARFLSHMAFAKVLGIGSTFAYISKTYYPYLPFEEQKKRYLELDENPLQWMITICSNENTLKLYLDSLEYPIIPEFHIPFLKKTLAYFKNITKEMMYNLYYPYLSKHQQREQSSLIAELEYKRIHFLHFIHTIDISPNFTNLPIHYYKNIRIYPFAILINQISRCTATI